MNGSKLDVKLSLRWMGLVWVLALTILFCEWVFKHCCIRMEIVERQPVGGNIDTP